MERDLLKFGYTKKWLDYGMLTEEFFNEQKADQIQTGHMGWEHYRYGAFTHWLQSNSLATTIEISNFIELAEEDKDKNMGNSAILMLLETTWLTNEQFNIVKSHAHNIGDSAIKYIMRTELLRDLKQNNLNEQLFKKCLSLGDAHVHKALIENKGITRAMLKQLANNGYNKKIRNIAQQLSQSRKYA